MPPFVVWRDCGCADVSLRCRLTMFTPATVTVPRSGWVARTSPTRPLSLPAMTFTRSPLRTCSLTLFLALRVWVMSDHLRGERDDAHEALLAELTADRAEDAGATGLRAVGAEDHRGVLVELDVRAVAATVLLDGAHDDGLDDVALLDVAARDRVLDGGDDDVADAGVAPTRAAEHTDAEDLLGARVVGDLESRLLLDHRFLSWLSCWFSSARGSEPGRTGGGVGS